MCSIQAGQERVFARDSAPEARDPMLGINPV